MFSHGETEKPAEGNKGIKVGGSNARKWDSRSEDKVRRRVTSQRGKNDTTSVGGGSHIMIVWGGVGEKHTGGVSQSEKGKNRHARVKCGLQMTRVW